MPDAPTPPSGSNTPVSRRSFSLWILIILAVVALGGAVFWLADGPNRYHASQEMRAGRMALLASDLSKALGHFRAAALLRPTDETIILQYDQTQSRWVNLVEQQLQKLEPVEAYQAWLKLPPTEGELVEPHASRYREIRTRVETGARAVAAQYVADARDAWESNNFAQAYELLHTAEPLAALVPELPKQLKEAQAAEVAHVMAAGRESMELGDFEGARAAMKMVAALPGGNVEYQKLATEIDAAEVAQAMAVARAAIADEKFDGAREALNAVATLAAKNEEYGKVRLAIDEAEVRANLRDAAQAIEKGEFQPASDSLARAAEFKVLAEDVAAAQTKLRNVARMTATIELARGIADDDVDKVTEALEKGRLYADWDAVPAESLLQPTDLPSFLKSLEAFKLGTEAQAAFTNRLDIPLVMHSRRKFPEAAVTEYLRTGFREWSRRMAQYNLSGLALCLDGMARDYGAPADESWRQETIGKAVESAHVRVSVADAPDPDAPEGLNAAATVALRRALQAQLGDWPKLVDYDAEHPATVVLRGRYAGFDASDNPDTETRTVRYQSGTRRVTNDERNRLLDQHNDVMDQRNQLVQSIEDNQYKVNRLHSGEALSDWERSEGIGASGALVVQRYRFQKLEAEVDDLAAQLKAMPKTLEEPVYAEEEYKVIDHHYTYTITWQLDANMHGKEVTVGQWTAEAEFQTREIAGNRSHGVPVKEPEPLPREQMESELVGKLVVKVEEVDAVIDQLPAMTMEGFSAFFEKNKDKKNRIAEANQYLALVYAWEAAGRNPNTQSFKPGVFTYARAQLNLPE